MANETLLIEIYLTIRNTSHGNKTFIMNNYRWDRKIFNINFFGHRHLYADL